jgi:hypothetical protein
MGQPHRKPDHNEHTNDADDPADRPSARAEAARLLVDPARHLRCGRLVGGGRQMIVAHRVSAVVRGRRRNGRQMLAYVKAAISHSRRKTAERRRRPPLFAWLVVSIPERPAYVPSAVGHART